MSKRSKKSRKTGIIVVVALVLISIIFLIVSRTSDSELGLEDIHGIAVDVNDPEKLYVANHHGLYSLTSETGLTNVSSVSADFMSLAVHPSDSNTLFVSGHPEEGGNLGLQKSVDGGETWDKVSDGLDGPIDFHAMAVDNINPDVIYGVHGGEIQKSDDGGLSWVHLEEFEFDIYQLVSGGNEGTIYAATFGGLLVSEDSGDTWDKLSGELSEITTVAVANSPKDSDELFSYSNKLGLAKSSNAGKTWQSTSSDLFSDQIVLFIDYSSDGGVIYIATQALNIYKSNDGGTSWEQVY